MFVLLSLPHTGTIFTRTFLETTPGVDGRRGLNQLGSDGPPEGNYVLWGHFFATEWHYQADWCRKYRPIVPMRDPLLTAMSHQVRNSAMDVANWALASVVMDAHVAHYLTLDLLNAEENRILGLRAALKAGGWEQGDSISHCRQWAREWDQILSDKDKSNTAGPNHLKQIYADGDFDRLSHEMPERITALQKHERSLRPWLERMGYENLLWWS